jgi:hypothetical protein
MSQAEKQRSRDSKRQRSIESIRGSRCQEMAATRAVRFFSRRKIAKHKGKVALNTGRAFRVFQRTHECISRAHETDPTPDRWMNPLSLLWHLGSIESLHGG